MQLRQRSSERSSPSGWQEKRLRPTLERCRQQIQPLAIQHQHLLATRHQAAPEMGQAQQVALAVCHRSLISGVPEDFQCSLQSIAYLEGHRSLMQTMPSEWTSIATSCWQPSIWLLVATALPGHCPLLRVECQDRVGLPRLHHFLRQPQHRRPHTLRDPPRRRRRLPNTSWRCLWQSSRAMAPTPLCHCQGGQAPARCQGHSRPTLVLQWALGSQWLNLVHPVGESRPPHHVSCLLCLRQPAHLVCPLQHARRHHRQRPPALLMAALARQAEA